MSSTDRDRRGPFSGSAQWGLVLVVLLVGLLAYWARVQNAIGFGILADPASGEVISAAPSDEAWGSYDPDTLYHARRVERGVRDHGWIASFDPLLSHGAELVSEGDAVEGEPNGGEGPASGAKTATLVHPAFGVPIPWPPFYDLLLTALYRGAIPSPDALMEPEAYPTAPPLAQPERDAIERFVASVPSYLGALTAILVALIAAGRARRLSGQSLLEAGRSPTSSGLHAAALAAAAMGGLALAFAYGHLRYSHLGNGDHHAFISLLHVGMLGLTARALDHDRIVQPFWSAARGTGAGLLAAMMLTSWTASILWIALIQLALVIRLLVPFRAPDGRRFSAKGLPIFATSFHKAALLGVVPAVIESPFSDLSPWSLVELSWLHLTWLCVGWLIFAPYALMPQTAAKSRLAAMAPAALVILATLTMTSAPSSVAGAFSWASASNAFMSSINESKSLVEGGSLSPLIKFCGAGIVVAPIFWFGWWRAVGRQPSLLPLLLTLPVCIIAAWLQRRFAESLAGPLAIGLGVWVGVIAGAVESGREKAGSKGRLGAIALLAGVLALCLNSTAVSNIFKYRARAEASGGAFSNASPIAQREAELAAFLTGVRSEVESPPAMLAHWDLGHAIEWRAGFATVATNFGLYVGEDAFLDPWRFYVETDLAAAEELLVRRDVEFVLMDGDRNRAAMGAALDVPVVADTALWRGTMAARLLRDGAGEEPQPVPGFLALVEVASHDGGGNIELYRRVQGAVLEASGARSIRVTATVRGADGTQVTWRASADAETAQVEPLRLRVPYSSPGAGAVLDAPERDPWGQRLISLEVFVDGVRSSVTIPSEAVETGQIVTLL